MSKKEIYELLDKLGMVGGDVEIPETNDIVEIINFVDELFLFNDEATMKKFLVCLFAAEEKNKIKE